jgi:hypothetical protein
MSGDTVSYEIRMGLVRYEDITQVKDVTKSRFFAKSECKTLEVYGQILQFNGYVRVLQENDISDDEECEGMIIPEGCVLDIVYLESPEDKPQLTAAPAPSNTTN